MFFFCDETSLCFNPAVPSEMYGYKCLETEEPFKDGILCRYRQEAQPEGMWWQKATMCSITEDDYIDGTYDVLLCPECVEKYRKTMENFMKGNQPYGTIGRIYL